MRFDRRRDRIWTLSHRHGIALVAGLLGATGLHLSGYANGIISEVPYAFALTWCVYLLVGAAAKHRANAYRRAGLAELLRLKSLSTGNELSQVAAVSELLKRVALAAWPRQVVASLTGKAWLQFLDQTTGGITFTSGPGSILADASATQDRIEKNKASLDLDALTIWTYRSQ